MAWTQPLYTPATVDQAGETYTAVLASPEERELALAVINNWRSSHAFPLNTLQINLRRVTNDFDRDPTVAQRIKRLPSIRAKLERFDWLSLSEMQDIGGCRAVLSSVANVRKVADFYKGTSRMHHELIREDDYISNPKRSGYRGIHLIYGYASDKKPIYNGLKIEMQIRSRLQHAWATAVETVGTFTRQALKSSMGEQEWLRFFVLMSSVFAARERTPPAPRTPDDPQELKRELRRLADRLQVLQRLSVYGAALDIIQLGGAAPSKKTMFLLELDVATPSLRWTPFNNPLAAAEAYDAMERAIAGDPTKDAVLVAVESLDALRRAYPNYFLDTEVFLAAVGEAIE